MPTVSPTTDSDDVEDNVWDFLHWLYLNEILDLELILEWVKMTLKDVFLFTIFPFPPWKKNRNGYALKKSQNSINIL